ncbi:MAG: putative quinol monooxygenase [Chloroflexota bacterium]|nr:putative quinol monooxygenase [Chloroflexota bacterium]
MIVVAAHMKAIEGRADELVEEFRKLVPKVLNDDGTVAYVVHRSVNDPCKIFVYEKYESSEALKAHSATPHFKEFSGAIASLLDGRPEVALYSEID